MDPIKPFTTLIRSLQRSEKSGDAQSAGRGASTAHVSVVAGVAAIQNRLQTRLATLDPWDAKRARELFVESTLLHEFGAELLDDPAFFELVQRVSLHLGGEAAISERLDQLLRELNASRVTR